MSEVLSSSTETLSVGLSKSVQFRHLGIQWEKAALNPLVSNWSVPFKFCFFGEKTRFTRAIAVNKQANFHNFKIKNLNLLTITFPAIYLLNRSKSLYINQWWEWIILSVRSLTAFEENIVVTVLAKLSLFQSFLEAF